MDLQRRCRCLCQCRSLLRGIAKLAWSGWKTKFASGFLTCPIRRDASVQDKNRDAPGPCIQLHAVYGIPHRFEFLVPTRVTSATPSPSRIPCVSYLCTNHIMLSGYLFILMHVSPELKHASPSYLRLGVAAVAPAAGSPGGGGKSIGYLPSTAGSTAACSRSCMQRSTPADKEPYLPLHPAIAAHTVAATLT